jgi:hypothetical protein
VAEKDLYVPKKNSNTTVIIPKWTGIRNYYVSWMSQNGAGNLVTSSLLFSPLDYFRIVTGKELLMLSVHETNKYATQSNLNKPLDLTVPEFEHFLYLFFAHLL